MGRVVCYLCLPSTPHLPSLFPQATCNTSGVSVALKVYKLDAVNLYHHHQIFRELCIHSRLNHPNIIQLYASFQVGAGHTSVARHSVT